MGLRKTRPFMTIPLPGLGPRVPIVVDMSGKGDLFPTVLGLWRAPGMLSRVYGELEHEPGAHCDALLLRGCYANDLWCICVPLAVCLQ